MTRISEYQYWKREFDEIEKEYDLAISQRRLTKWKKEHTSRINGLMQLRIKIGIMTHHSLVNRRKKEQWDARHAMLKFPIMQNIVVKDVRFQSVIVVQNKGGIIPRNWGQIKAWILNLNWNVKVKEIVISVVGKQFIPIKDMANG